MKEFSFILLEEMTKGLLPDKAMQKNARYLSECYGMKPTPEGLKVCPSITNPVSSMPTFSWPFGQFIDGHNLLLLYWNNTIGTLASVNTTTWATTSIATDSTLLSAVTGGVGAVVDKTGGLMNSLSFGGKWFMSNGKSFLTDSNLYSSWASGHTSTCLVPASICQHGMNVIMGGFTGPSSFYTTEHWKQLWNMIRTVWSMSPPVTDTGFDRLIFCGPIGGGTNQPFLLESLFLTGKDHAEGQALLRDMILDKRVCFVQAPTPSPILRLQALGDKVVVYTKDSVGYITPVRGIYLYQHIGPVGLKDRNAVTSGPDYQLFVGSDSALYMLGGDKPTLMRLGYEQYLSQLTGTLSMQHDMTEGESYISSGSKCYIFTGKGMGEYQLPVSSLFRRNSNLYGSVGAEASGKSGTFEVVSHVRDNNRRAIKRLFSVELQGDKLANSSVDVEYKYKDSESYTRHGAKVVNDELVAFPIVSGTDLKVVVSGTRTNDLTLDNVIVRWNATDYRHLRGLLIDVNSETRSN